jgi:cytochrome c oxidase cbb3-type subunit III
MAMCHIWRAAIESYPELMRNLSAFLILCALFLLASIDLRSQAQGPPQPTPEQRAAIDRGRTQFQQACGFCHGPDATGARGPDLVRSALVAHDVNGDLVGEVILNGRPDKGMPALPLTAAQISDIAAFLHARSKEAVESSGVPSDYPFEKLLTGNADKGKAYFEGAGGCSKCHSPAGDLIGIAHKYNAIELQAHMLYPDDKPALATVTLPSGEQLSGVVSHIDDFTVGVRIGDKNGWYRSFPRSRVKLELKDPLAAHRELLPKISQTQMHDLFTYLYSLK